MPTTRFHYTRIPLARISIDGHFLDDTRTRIDETYPGGVSYRGCAIESCRATAIHEGLRLHLPALTALQLYHEGILTADRTRTVEIGVAGKSKGDFYIASVLCPSGHDSSEPVILEFSRMPPPLPEPRKDPYAWVEELVPLKLNPVGDWDPASHYWGEEGEPVEEWARPIIARGRRPSFEMEQVLPGADSNDPDDDPILAALAQAEAGRKARAKAMLERLMLKDLRCLDAHAHLGSMCFNSDDPLNAIGHYQLGVRIGRHSVGKDFDGVLSWGRIDNRPYLRCLQGYGLTLWRLRRFEEAGDIFEQLLWLNPTDNQGARFVLPQIRKGQHWTPED